MRRQLVGEAMKVLHDSDEAEDAVQDTVIKLWTMRDRLDEYRSVESLAMVVVRRLALNRLRGVRKVEVGENREDGELSPEERFIHEEEQREMTLSIARLPDKQRAVLRMKHIEGLETEEIARLIGITEEAVRKNLSRARRALMRRF